MAVIRISKGAQWRKEIKKAFDDFEADVNKEVEKRVLKWAKYLLEKAIMNRLVNKYAHNFTGNLLNSIVAGVYKDRVLIQAYYSSETGHVRSAIRRKMTAPREYYFTEDYDHRVSHFKADVTTDQGHGSYDARTFILSYRPSFQKKSTYTIVVAYTTEYAEYLATSGFEDTVMDAHNTGREYGFKLKSMSLDQNTASVLGFNK